MTESVLFKSYRATEKRKARQALDEALARIDAAEAELAPPPPGGVSPDQPLEPRVSYGGAAPQPERAPGVAASVGRGLRSISERFGQGGQDMADAIYPARPPQTLDELSRVLTGEAAPTTMQSILASRPVRFFLGAINVIFPFGAFAGETGGDLAEYLARASGQMTDESLRKRLAEAESRDATPKIGENAGELSAVDTASDEASLIRNLLVMPEKERLEQVRQFGSVFSEILAGTVPGYTNASTPRRRR
jgi:hypothetical protein